MAAPKGNRFWEMRSKHGRDRLFETPDLLWEAACEYFGWCDENPLIETDFKGKDADEVHIPRIRAYTLQGLCLYLDCNAGYFTDFETALKEDDTETAEDFSRVITRIRETIFTQKFEGAAAGLLNANIISRDLGLVDRKDMTTAGRGLSQMKIEVVDPATAENLRKLQNTQSLEESRKLQNPQPSRHPQPLESSPQPQQSQSSNPQEPANFQSPTSPQELPEPPSPQASLNPQTPGGHADE